MEGEQVKDAEGGKVGGQVEEVDRQG